jgi:hypothetical protein
MSLREGSSHRSVRMGIVSTDRCPISNRRQSANQIW